jgi:FKBP-type peptidyl-prolyl cis-trans isomerase
MKSVICVAFFLTVGGAAWAQSIAPQVPAESASAAQQRLGQSPRESPRQKAALASALAAEANQKNTGDYLAKNAKAPGVQLLSNGVQYKVLKAGNGKRPQISSTVRCQLIGTLEDGFTFDKIDDKGGAFLAVKGMVPGLQSAVTAMSVGAKWQIVVPPALGYGTKGTHGVAPNAVLIYQFELLAIK